MKPASAGVRVAYCVPRLPFEQSQTFLLNEIESVAAVSWVDVVILPTGGGTPTSGGRLERSANLARLVPAGARATRAAYLRAAVYWLMRDPVNVVVTFSLAVLPRLLRWAQPRAMLDAWLCALQQAKALHGEPLDHIHAHFPLSSEVAWVISRLLRVPFSFSTHSRDIFVDQIGLRRRVRAATFVATISAFNREFLRRRVGAKAVEIVRCGVDVDALTFRLPRAPGPAPVVICVARLSRYKGQDILVRALADPRLRRARAVLIGDGEEAPSLRDLAVDLGVDNRVEFRGWQNESAVAEALRSADVFVLPSRVDRDGNADGIPVALMEAMAVGVPVVSSRISGIPELVKDQDTGRLVPPDDVAALSDAIAESLADDRADMPLAARQLIETEFALAASGRRLAGLFASRAGTARSTA